VHGIGAYDETGERRDISLPEEMDVLCKTIEQMPNVKLVILDPIVLSIANDSHKDLDVRRGLYPLVKLAKDQGIAVLGIAHFAKNTAGRDPLDRVAGSLAFGAQARVVWVASKDEEANQNVLCLAKSNIGLDNGGWRYELGYAECKTAPYIPALFIVWKDKITGSAREILSEVESANEKVGALSEAKAFLLDILSDGPMPQRVIEEKAKAENISRATLRRAKTNLGVKSTKETFNGMWRWQLPENENTQDAEDAHEDTHEDAQRLYVTH